MPRDKLVKGTRIPYYFVADPGFQKCKRILTTGRGKLGNMNDYRLSRARVTVETAFGLLSQKWRCVYKGIKHQPDIAGSMVMACCAKHNFLIRHDDDVPTTSTAECATDERLTGLNNLTRESIETLNTMPVQTAFTKYFLDNTIREQTN